MNELTTASYSAASYILHDCPVVLMAARGVLSSLDKVDAEQALQAASALVGAWTTGRRHRRDHLAAWIEQYVTFKSY